MRTRTFNMEQLAKGKKFQMDQDEVDQIRADAKESQALLENPFFVSLLSKSKEEILEIHAKQILYDSEESIMVGDKQKTIKFPAHDEYKMLAGQYRFIEQLFEELRLNVDIARQLEEKIATQEVEVNNVES